MTWACAGFCGPKALVGPMRLPRRPPSTFAPRLPVAGHPRFDSKRFGFSSVVSPPLCLFSPPAAAPPSYTVTHYRIGPARMKLEAAPSCRRIVDAAPLLRAPDARRTPALHSRPLADTEPPPAPGGGNDLSPAGLLLCHCVRSISLVYVESRLTLEFRS